MSKNMMLDVLTPERTVCCTEVEFVIARAVDGEIGILWDHAPLLSSWISLRFRYWKDGVEYAVAVNGGLMEVKDNRISLLAPTAETANGN